MSSKYSGTGPTHKPLPWCKKAPIPPILPIGGIPGFLQASLRFYQCLPSGTPRDVSFYLPNIKLSPTGHGAATATSGEFTASLSLWYNSLTKKLLASADLFDGGGPVAALQLTTIDCAAARPIFAEILHFANGIPTGQDGRLTTWE